MNFKINETDEKLRGSYYTPNEVASFLTSWVLSKKPKSILEPSCGNGAFITAFNNQHSSKISFTGIEIVAAEMAKSRKKAKANQNLTPNIICADFLEWFLNKRNHNVLYDAVIGNPPYIRYQYLDEHSQIFAEKVFSSFQLPFTKHTNAWVPFVIASLALVRPGGRIAMVIPSEILHVLHAASLRKFLFDNCERILLIDPNELLFEGVLQGTMLLMAEKRENAYVGSGKVAIFHMPNNSFLTEDPEKYFESANYIGGDILNGKWTKLLLSSEELAVFEKAKRSQFVRRFSSIASVDVGIVTGANDFFLVNDEIVKRFNLQNYVRPMFGRSGHCPGVIYDKKNHLKNREKGLPTNFVMLEEETVKKYPADVRNYLKQGEERNLHKRYKCRVRSPWFKVPSVYATRIGMLKRSHNFPRLILNTSGAFTTDTAYRIQPYDKNDSDKFVFCFINSLTALTAELEGRHYGGGVLELVPSEIEKLLIPFPNKINYDLFELDKKIRKGVELESILREQDAIILKAVGLSSAERQILHKAWQRVRARRLRNIHSLTSPGGTDG